jgi:predicted Holliday junction resolvase-like endonuclease
MESVTFTQFGVFVGCIVVLLGIAATVKSLFTRQPPLHREYVDRATYEADKKKLDDEQARQSRNRKERYNLEEQREQARTAAIADLKARSEAQGEAIRQLSGEVSEMQGRIDAIPGRTIELLRGTKGLLD